MINIEIKENKSFEGETFEEAKNKIISNCSDEWLEVQEVSEDGEVLNEDLILLQEELRKRVYYSNQGYQNSEEGQALIESDYQFNLK
ncbi:MAG: hypothetical protein ACJAW3_001331 [Lentimonas sp.]|jgi:hypothetical protein